MASPASPRRPPVVGRDSERANVLSRLAAERVVVLHGPPGSGKTTLARAIASEMAGDRAVSIVPLEHARDRDDVLTAIGHAAGASSRAADRRVIVDRLAERLDEASALLVLDGVEHVRAAVREIIDELVDFTSELTILVTSRERLGSSHEIVVTVGPLEREAAATLLVERVSRARASATVPHATALRLVERAGCLPLVVEIVAARVTTLGAAEALASIEAGILPLDALDRALDASTALLGGDVRDAFAELGVFRGPFALEGAQAIAGAERAVVAIDALVNASLLAPSDSAGGATRFAMLEGVRAYAQRLAEQRGVAGSARERHAAFFAARAAPRADAPSSWTTLARDRDDLLAAWDHAQRSDAKAATKLALALDVLLVTQGPAVLHQSVLRAALERIDADDMPGEAADLALALGRSVGLRGNHEDAIALFRRAKAHADHAKDRGRRGWASAFLCFSLRALCRFDEARAAGDDALHVAATAKDLLLEAMAAQALGMTRLAEEDTEGALGLLRRARAAAHTGAAPRLEAIAEVNLAITHRTRGEIALAEASLAAARSAFDAVGDRFHLAACDVVGARIVLDRGELDAAEAALVRALDAVLEQGNAEAELDARTALALVASRRGDVRLANHRWDELDLLARSSGDPLARERIARARRDAVPDGRARGAR